MSKLITFGKVVPIPEHFREATSRLADLGIEDPHIFGGCLRDWRIGKPHRDIDVRAPFPEGNNFWKQAASIIDETLPLPKSRWRIRKYYIPELADAFKQAGGMRLISAAPYRSLNYHGYHLTLHFKTSAHRTETVDPSLVRSPKGKSVIDTLSQNFENPLNSLVLHPDSTLLGFPDALEHIDKRIFEASRNVSPGLSPRSAWHAINAFSRYSKIAQHIPDLTFECSKDDSLYAHILQLFDSHSTLPRWAGAALHKWRRPTVFLQENSATPKTACVL